MKIRAVLFDFIGTTVKETNSHSIAKSISDACIEHGIFLKPEYFNSVRGKDKTTTIKDLLDRYDMPVSMALTVSDSFTKNIRKDLEYFSAFGDSLFVFSYLLRIGILTGIGTGLSREVFDIIFSHLGWSKKVFNYIGFSDEIGKSRAAPGMIQDMMSKLRIKDPREVLKVGDTIADIREGKKAGCITAVVLSGSQSAKELIKEKPDYVLESLSDVRKIINEHLRSVRYIDKYKDRRTASGNTCLLTTSNL